jgi:hypothetical protein
VRFPGKKNNAILSAGCFGDLRVYFFGAADVKKGKEVPNPVFFFQRFEKSDHPADKDERKDKNSFSLSFQEQALI